METSTIVLVVLSLIISLSIGYFQYYYKVKNVKKINLYLFLLRSVVLFLLFILLINPTIEKKSFQNQKPALSVLVDNSESTKFFNQEEAVNSFLSKLKSNQQLNEKFDINYYSFGEEFRLNDSLTFDETQTNLYQPLKSINSINKGKNNAVILVSDGNQTVGSDYQYTNVSKPIYPLIIGDTVTYEDVSIAQLNVNRYSFLNNQFPIEALLYYEGTNKRNVRFTIENNGKIVYRKQIRFDTDNPTQTVQVNLKSEKEGVNFYTARLNYLENEKNTSNNRKNFSVEVIDKQSQILLLSSIYHPDLGALKKSIEKDQQRKVTIKLIDDSNFQINDYQLVVMYQPNFQFKSVFKEIKEKKINFFLITGAQTDWNFLNNENLGVQKNSIDQSEDYSARFNAGYLIYAQKDIDFNNFPPLKDKFGNINITIPYQTLLYQSISGFSSEEPLLATSDENNHKKIFLFGEDIWKWRSTSFLSSNTFEKFDEFIGNLMQYASSKKVRDRLDVDINTIYNANSIINVSAFYVDSNFEFDSRATLIFTLVNKETNERISYPFSLNANSYQLELEALPSGEYNYTVSVEGQDISRRGSFKVNEFSVEEQFTNANTSKLQYLSEKTQGKVFYINQEGLLTNELLNDSQYVTIQKSILKKESIIDWKWILFLIVGLLTIEWFTRKYHGKI